jgi:hypothetical protein
MKKENGLLRSQSEQRAREVCYLEEELRKIKACLNQSQNSAEELRGEHIGEDSLSFSLCSPRMTVDVEKIFCLPLFSFQGGSWTF